LIFCFSSRRRHTRCYRDWSSDVCSSDLLPLSPRNANTMWMLHFLAHLKEHTAREPGGTAGFVMARGELSNSEIARIAVRKALVEIGRASCRERVESSGVGV